MKVAIFQTEVLPYRIPFFEALAARQGIDLHLFVFDLPNQPVDFSVEVIKKRGVANFLWFGPGEMNSDFDLIVLPFDLRLLSIYYFLLVKKKPVVLWGHGMGRNKHVAIIRQQLINVSAGFIAYEPAGMREFTSNKVNEKKLFFAGNSIRVGNAEFSQQQRTYFLYLGRLQERKKLDCAINVVADIHAKGRLQPYFHIVGDGPIKPSLMALAKLRNVHDYVHFFPGTFDEVELKRHFSGAKAYLSPGHVGLGVIHAFAYGAPVITFDLKSHAPEVENIVDDKTGSLVNNTHSDLLSCIERYETNECLVLRLGKAAHQWYSKERTLDRMVSRYASALALCLHENCRA